jgi:signal transduction histidine kinase
VHETAPSCIHPASLEQLYRLAQEAFANALQHASASKITIKLDVQPLLVKLVVEDDGIGMRPDAFDSAGAGLKLMQHRARIIGASLAITHCDPHGTRVTLRCPYVNESPAWRIAASQTGRVAPSIM